jgi:aldose 1-epimerase
VKYLIIIALVFGMFSCSQSLSSNTDVKPTVNVTNYGYLDTGELIKQYELVTENIRVKAINYGGIITNIEVPDRNGNWQDVVLGYDNLADYHHKNRFFGALIGRYANRIKHGVAKVNDEQVQLSINRPPHQLHGGVKGFDKQIWQATTELRKNGAALHLTLVSPDGHEGYPGELNVKVSYIVTNNGQLDVEYQAKTNKNTIFNPTQHSYFNLSGDGRSDILDHELTINAKRFVELDFESIPTGKLLSVTNTPLDFQNPKVIGKHIHSDHKQLQIARGYDHYFVGKAKRGLLTEIGHLYHQKSGRSLRISSTERGAQLYSANYLTDTVVGKNGIASRPRQGVCIETGQLPNAPAEELFNTYILTPESPFYSLTRFYFSTM